ncbi:MAG: hypothetical protein LE168_01830 [Endomicrobium sp.]|nr:hypothetical protein [Endomicrobium sp.]
MKTIISGSYDAYNNNEREISVSNDKANSVVDKKIVVKAKDFTGYGVSCNLETIRLI